MSNEPCLIEGCTETAYAPAGTQGLCKEHFLQFSAWRKKKGGLSFFKKYSAMSMEDRDRTIEEWVNSLLTTPTS